MVGGKKWLAVFTDEQHAWIKSTSSELGIKGTVVIRELVDIAMSENPKQFKNRLANMQLKLKLQEINDKRAILDEEVLKLKKQLTGEREKAVA